VPAIVAPVDEFERAPARFKPEECRANAARYSAAHFRRRFVAQIDAQLPNAHAPSKHAGAKRPPGRPSLPASGKWALVH
ncbi:hypothetical protein AAHH79_40075, partial [Burkholderia pseudomallei]